MSSNPASAPAAAPATAPAAAPASEGPVSYIGSRISLISKAGVRYEGTLFTIDPKEATVALHQVKIFGTEDRKAATFMPASSDLYEFITFRGSDIQDLHICELASSTPAAKPAIQDPVIVSAKLASTPTAAAGAQAPVQQSGPATAPPRQSQGHGRNNNNQHRRGGGAGGAGDRRNNATSEPAAAGAEFDFESANARFDKSKFLAEMQSQGQGVDSADYKADDSNEQAARQALANMSLKAEPKYDKTKSFFDTLSNDRDDNAGQANRNDSETFGAAATRGRRGGRRGGGRGRGGRGGGFGGPHGGSQGAHQPRQPREWRDYSYSMDDQPKDGSQSQGGAGGRGGRRRGGGGGRGRGRGGNASSQSWRPAAPDSQQ